MTLDQLIERLTTIRRDCPELGTLPVWYSHDLNVPLYSPLITYVTVDRARRDEKGAWMWFGTRLHDGVVTPVREGKASA